MSTLHKCKCNHCQRTADLTYNGEHWLTPKGWHKLYSDHRAEVLQIHLCDKCCKKLLKTRELGV